MARERVLERLHLDVVAFHDRDGLRIAQCIQYDIVARAKSVLDVRKAFGRQLRANPTINEKLGRKGLEGIPRAPDRFKQLFESAIEHMTPLTRVDEIGPGLPLDSINIRLNEAARSWQSR